MKNKLEKLQQIATGADLEELTMAITARDTTRAAYYAGYAADAKLNMDAAAANLRQVVDTLYGRLVETDRLYENIKAMLDYLQAQGYKVSQGKLYGDAKAGYLRLDADRSISKQGFADWCANPKGGLDIISVAEAAEEKASADLKRLAQREKELDVATKEENLKQKQMANRKEDAKWILKADAYLQMAGQLGILKDALDHHVTMGESKLILAAGGKLEKSPEFSAMLKAVLTTAFNEIATSGRLEVLFESIDEDADDDHA